MITEYNSQGGATKKENALIHDSAEIGYDGVVYNWQQQIYLAQRFSQEEISQVNEAKRISQTSSSASIPYYQKQTAGEAFIKSTTSNPINSSGSLGIATVVIVSVLAVVSLGIYGISSVIKKSKKIKK